MVLCLSSGALAQTVVQYSACTDWVNFDSQFSCSFLAPVSPGHIVISYVNFGTAPTLSSITDDSVSDLNTYDLNLDYTWAGHHYFHSTVAARPMRKLTWTASARSHFQAIIIEVSADVGSRPLNHQVAYQSADQYHGDCSGGYSFTSTSAGLTQPGTAFAIGW